MNDTVRQALALAAEYLAAKRFGEAEALYRRVIDLNPEVAEAYFNLGAALRLEGRWAEAAATLKKSLPLIRAPHKYHSILMMAVESATNGNIALGESSGSFNLDGIYPVTAEIEMTAHCQLKCPFCRTGGDLRHQYPQVSRGYMKRETLSAILEKIPSLFYVRLYNWGEPFLHPDLPGMIETVKKHGRYCEVSTNMQIMTPELAERLVRSGLDLIRISCDGTTQEAYAQYRKGGDLGKVVEHSRILADKKRKLESIRPVMIFQMVVNRYNEHQIDEFVPFAEAAGADVTERLGICPMTTEGVDMFEFFVPNDPRYPRYTPVKPLSNCRQPWTHVSFDWNGDVYTCCNPSGLSEYRIGNVNDGTFGAIWNSDAYVEARRLIRTQQPAAGERAHACADICFSREFNGKWYA